MGGVQAIFCRMARLPGCLFLDSSMQLMSAGKQPLGRYSFLMADPIERFTAKVADKDVFSNLRTLKSRFASQQVRGLPPFQGGLAGLFSYDINQLLERIPRPKFDEFNLPVVSLGLYDVVIAIDQLQETAWIISQGWPESSAIARLARAQRRIESFLSILTNNRQPDKTIPGAERSQLAARMYEVPGPAGLLSNFSRDQYLDAVARAIEYVHAGDVFQVNVAQQLMFPADRSAVELYLDLRAANPAPFSAFYDLGTAQIISASPERLVFSEDGRVETRPIKGTRRRTRFPEVDLEVGMQLLESEKDRAENTMIVDLMRNDLSRVCTDDSVVVSQLCQLEKYQSVLHLVSAVQGTLRDDRDVFDLLTAVLPGGSITGAPKIRAMEIIAQLEPSARGAYCGSLGYIGMDGTIDFNILIRTITASHGWWQVPVGGGIVSQSDPQLEYDETWTKAAGMLQAIQRDASSASSRISIVPTPIRT